MSILNYEMNLAEWISEEEACELMQITRKVLRRKCHKKELIYTTFKIKNKNRYNINIKSIPAIYFERLIISKADTNSDYSNAPDWAKSQANKYSSILHESKNLSGHELFNFVENWNINNPDSSTSYSSIIKMRKRYLRYGVSGLLAKYGKPTNNYIDPIYYNYFKSLYLSENRPSAQSCWDITRGYALRVHNIDLSTFPCCRTFVNKIKFEIPDPSMVLAREGSKKYNSTRASFNERNYSNIVCGKVWVSDHAQIDVMVYDENGKTVCPWVTAWSDYKSGKWLGWYLQTGNPNSDHIFQTFYSAVQEFGLPDSVIIDNGKDYRSKDFAGGRKPKVESNLACEANSTGAKGRNPYDTGSTRSMLGELNVEAHFALPYNAQTKTIERDFCTIKSLLSKHCVGYRGGNVVERPEKLAKEVKENKLMQFEDFKKVFDDFIVNVLNKRESKGKNLNGKSRNELFHAEFKEKVVPSKDALKLFCMRTSRNFTIKRNGIKDGQLDIRYWADWLVSKTGKKVYMRRDIQNHSEAWVFDAENEEFLGKVEAVKSVPALYANEISKDDFKVSLSIKKRSKKIAESYLADVQTIGIEEQIDNYKALYLNETSEPNPVVTKLANTNMDKVIRKNKQLESVGKGDLSVFADSEPIKDKLYLFDTDRIIEEELKGVANGY